MSELETIFQKHSTITVNTFVGQRRVMTSEQFKQALTEVAKLVEVTDEEILNNTLDLDEAVGAKSTRSVSKTKLEKLIG